MKINEEIKEAKEEIKKTSFAMEMVKESIAKQKELRVQNKRLFIIIIILLIILFVMGIYLVYVLNDISTIESDKIIDIKEVDNIKN